MPKICYKSKRFGSDARDCISTVNAIVADYARQGFDLTLRQVYYQLVARDLFPEGHKWSMSGSRWVRDPNGTVNAEPNYAWLSVVLNQARLAGLIDWKYIVDRTRNLEERSHWKTPAAIIRTCATAYNRDLWAGQPYRPEVWIEKDALKGVFEGVCTRNDVPYFSCRGYTSQSEMWAAAQRIFYHLQQPAPDGPNVVIFHFGDHDPSGLDMSRDIEDRLKGFLAYHLAEDRGYDPTDKDELEYGKEEVEERFEVRRIALTREQITQYNPPPNPAKKTDARFKRYVRETGLDESWELDALDPTALVDLVEESLTDIRNEEKWDKATKAEELERNQLSRTADKWSDVLRVLRGEL